jgi:fatty acid desaturase
MNTNWLIAAFIDWTIIIIVMMAASAFPIVTPLAWFAIGNRQHALGILGHDGAHQTILPKNRLLNDLLCNVFTFYPLMIPMEPYRKFHFEHHRSTNVDGDPELPLKAIGPFPMVAPFSQRKVFTHAFLDLFGFGIPQLLAFIIHVRARTLVDAIPYVFAVIVSGILVATGNWFMVALWFVSLWTTFWSCFRLRVWAEHVGLGAGETLEFKPTWWQRLWFLPHGSEYHKVHHDKPNVPFNHLHFYAAPRLKSLCEARTAV